MLMRGATGRRVQESSKVGGAEGARADMYAAGQRCAHRRHMSPQTLGSIGRQAQQPLRRQGGEPWFINAYRTSKWLLACSCCCPKLVPPACPRRLRIHGS